MKTCIEISRRAGRLMTVAVGVTVPGVALAQMGIPSDARLPDEPAGSVVPVITMAQQILPCLAADAGGVRAMINVMGLEDAEGNIRVQVYGEKPDDFLATGKKLLRIDVPTEEENPRVCVTFPKPGTYALVVMHDRNANGRADILTEGFGFSRNPELGFSQPDHDEVAFEVGEGVTEMDVELNYVFRLENKERRRRRRR